MLIFISSSPGPKEINFAFQIVFLNKIVTLINEMSLQYHWESSHEGSGRHPRQHGGACFRAAGRFSLILRC